MDAGGSTARVTKKTRKTRKRALTITPKPDQVDQVFKWIIEGNNSHDIIAAIKKEFPDAPADALLLAAGDQLRDASRFEMERVVGWAIASTRELYRRLVQTGDYAGALRAIKQTTEIAERYANILQPDEAEAEAKAQAKHGTHKGR